MSQRTANPRIVDFSSTVPIDELEETHSTEVNEWLELPFSLDEGFPQDKSFVIQIANNNRTYRIRFDYNYSFGEYFMSVRVWDITNIQTQQSIFVRKIIPNIIYNVGYMYMLFLEVNITEKYIRNGDDPLANIQGVVRAIE